MLIICTVIEYTHIYTVLCVRTEGSRSGWTRGAGRLGEGEVGARLGPNAQAILAPGSRNHVPDLVP